MSQRAAARAGARPLGGRTIVVTRAAAQAQRFTQLLQEAGARVLEAPAIVIAPPPSWDPLDTALGQLESFRWVVFTSVNGVAMVDRRLVACGLGWGAMTGRGVAAIGPATAERIIGWSSEAIIFPLNASSNNSPKLLSGHSGSGKSPSATKIR